MDIINIDKFWYNIQEQIEVLVWYIGIYRPISSTDPSAITWAGENQNSLVLLITSSSLGYNFHFSSLAKTHTNVNLS
jgi:hypothetical protein